MDEDDLRAYLDICPVKYEKYIQKHVISTTIPIDKDGVHVLVVVRQLQRGSYTVLNEYLPVIKNWHVRSIVLYLLVPKYVNGEINNDLCKHYVR